MGMPIHVCITLSLQMAKSSAVRNAGYNQGTLSGVSMNLLCDLISP